MYYTAVHTPVCVNVAQLQGRAKQRVQLVGTAVGHHLIVSVCLTQWCDGRVCVENPILELCDANMH